MNTGATPGLGATTQSETHLWWANLDAPCASHGRNVALVAPAEGARSRASGDACGRKRYIRSHAFLRLVLSRYADCDPARIIYALGAFGKPMLAGSAALSGIHFSLSHSGAWAVVAVAGNEIGVDIERTDRDVNIMDLAASCFSTREFEELATYAYPDRDGAFFRGWTRKEAYLKALGLGLFGDLRSFDVSLEPAHGPRLVVDRLRPEQHGRWSTIGIPFQAGYCAALCTDRPQDSVKSTIVDNV